MKAQTRFSKQVIHRRETTEDKAGEVSRRRFVTSALATAAFAALRTLILADQQADEKAPTGSARNYEKQGERTKR